MLKGRRECGRKELRVKRNETKGGKEAVGRKRQVKKKKEKKVCFRFKLPFFSHFPE